MAAERLKAIFTPGNRLPLFLVAAAVAFNLILLAPELNITLELNDNVFGYSLVLRANQAWEEACLPAGRPAFIFDCVFKLSDHWVSLWAMGYPLPHFYQHIPHTTVVAIYQFLFQKVPLQTVYNFVKYILLSFIPVVFYLSARKFELPKLAAGFTAATSTLISTNFLYGTDYNALIWRGSGMYTQLWGIFFMPLAISSIYDTLRYRRGIVRSIIFLVLSFHSHVLFGYIAAISALILPPILWLAEKKPQLPDFSTANRALKDFLRSSVFARYLRLGAVFAGTVLLLAYWIVPLALNSAYHNKSVWDDLTKFNSFGFNQITKWLFNGDLLDYNRLPVLTALVGMGALLAIWKIARSWEGKEKAPASYLFLPIMLVVWYFLYFGRTTWGVLIDILPLSQGIHLHRFVNGIHFPALFLAGLTLSTLFTKVQEITPKVLVRLKIVDRNYPGMGPAGIFFALAAAGFILLPAIRERGDFVTYNSFLIREYERVAQPDLPDAYKALAKIKELGAGRVYAGRPGNWGRDYQIGGTAVYLFLSLNLVDTIGFLPESWSPNSDIEQFFDESRADHFDLFAIRYILAPPEQEFPAFAQETETYGKFRLYRTPTQSNFTFITSPYLVLADKRSKLNFNHRFLESTWVAAGAHPTISYASSAVSEPGQQLLVMLDWSNYQVGGERKNIFADNPFAAPPPATPSGQIIAETYHPDRLTATVETPQDLLLMAKMTFHPYWRVWVDGQRVETRMVSPAFLAFKVPAGRHEVLLEYGPSKFKIVLLGLSFFSLGLLLFLGKTRFLEKNLP